MTTEKPLPTLPVVSIATIIVISPAKGSFAHFLDACKKSGWIHPDGRVKQNHIRASQHVKNHFENYNICVAKKLPSDYPIMIHKVWNNEKEEWVKS